MEITVTVEGRTEETTITHTYSGHETQHKIPVLGLYPDADNQVILTGETEDGDILETTLEMAMDEVPEDLLVFTLVTSQPERMEEGLTFVSLQELILQVWIAMGKYDGIVQ